jgi:hypothetical protein
VKTLKSLSEPSALRGLSTSLGRLFQLLGWNFLTLWNAEVSMQSARMLDRLLDEVLSTFGSLDRASHSSVNLASALEPKLGLGLTTRLSTYDIGQRLLLGSFGRCALFTLGGVGSSNVDRRWCRFATRSRLFLDLTTLSKARLLPLVLSNWDSRPIRG